MDSRWYILFVRKNYETKILKDFDFFKSLNDFSWLNKKVSEIKFLKSEDKNGAVKNLVPGYMFIKCQIDKEVVEFIYSIKEVVGFLNYDRKNSDKMPSPLSNLEVNNFFLLLDLENENKNKEKKENLNWKNPTSSSLFENKQKEKKENFSFAIGDIVIIKEGVFKDNKGSVIQINKNLLTVNIEFLGRFTPVSIDSLHCERI